MIAKLTLSATILFGVAVLGVPAQNSKQRTGSGPTQNPTVQGGSPFFQAGGKQTGQGGATGKPTPPPIAPKLPIPPVNTGKPPANPAGSNNPMTNPMGKIFTNPNKTTGNTPPTTTTGRIPLPGNDKLKLPSNDKLKLPTDLKLGNKGPFDAVNPSNKGPFNPNLNVRKTPLKPTPNNNNATVGGLLKNGSVADFLKNGGQRRGNHGQFDLPFNVSAKAPNKQTKAPSQNTKGFAQFSAKTIENKYNDKLTPSQKTALNNFQTNGTWTPQDRAVVSNLVYTNSAGMTNQELASLSKALMVDRMLLNEDDESPVDAGKIATSPSQIRVINRTGEKLKLWVQYRNAAQPPSFEWNPMAANEKNQYELSALEYNLDPGDDDEGKAFDLRFNGKNLTAYSIHYWAMTPSEQWADYMEQELVLTPDPKSNVYELAFAR